jgi:hypothetical protein
VGACHVTGRHHGLARGRRPRPRICLRKGCERKYKPRCRIQRYCQEPECRRQVRRWQAARRQAKRRQDANVRAQRAEAEKLRRQQTKVVPQAAEDAGVTPARGHADEPFFRFHSVIGQAATNLPRPPSAIRHAIARRRVVKPSVMSKTVNANGSLAAPWMAVRNDSSSTRRLATAALHSEAASLTHHRYERLRIEDVSRMSRSSIIA